MEKRLNYLLFTLLMCLASSCNIIESSPSQSINESASESVSSESVSSESSSSESVFPSYEQETKDPLGLLPDEVVDAEVEIDVRVYNSAVLFERFDDAGSYSPYYNEQGQPYDPETGEIKLYGPKDFTEDGYAALVGAAVAFKKIAPNIKVNLLCGAVHAPAGKHDRYYDADLLVVPNNLSSLLKSGSIEDMSKYNDTPYYAAYNEYLLSRFNYGGFQAAVPYKVTPKGIFVNKQDLIDYSVVNGNNTEYSQWVDNFTWESFIDALEKTSTGTHAGILKITHELTSYSLGSIYNNYTKTGKVNFTSEKALSDLTKLLNYENEIATNVNYTAHLYNQEVTGGTMDNNRFPNGAPWKHKDNFLLDKYFTFYTGEDFYIDIFPITLKDNGLEQNKFLDMLPYPKVDENSNQYTGNIIEEIALCSKQIINTNSGTEKELEYAKLRQKVAAYFAMFIGADPRVAAENAKVEYEFYGVRYPNINPLPVIKKGFKYGNQDKDNVEDPAEGYDDNWQYIMATWFKENKIFITDDNEADVKNFSNISSGFSKVLDTIYGDKVTSINMSNEPKLLQVNNKQEYIFKTWDSRFTSFANKEKLTGMLGTSTYVESVLNELSVLENQISTDSFMLWKQIRDGVDSNYEYNNYVILDRKYRNEYEGAVTE